MSIIRVTKQKNFSIISNIPLNDTVLSFKAKGLWAYLMSKPDDWTIYTKQLTSAGPDGRDAIYSGMKELVQAGYMTREHVRDEAGKIMGLEYQIYEERAVNAAILPETDNPDTVNHSPVNPHLLSTDKELSIDLNDDVPPAPQQTQQPPLPEPPTVPSSSLKTPEKKQPTPAPTPPVNFQSPIAFSPPATDQPDMATAITALCLLLPDQFSKPSVKARLVQAIKQGHSIDTLKDTLQWCLKTTKATGYQSFKNYLGKTIDNGYAPENSEQEAMEDTVAVDKAAIQARLELPAGALKAMAETGDKYAIRALKIIKQE